MKKLFLMLGVIGLFLVGCSGGEETIKPNPTTPTEEVNPSIPGETEKDPVIPSDSESKPTESKPTDTEPTESKPSETKPTDSKPVAPKPSETEVELPWV